MIWQISSFHDISHLSITPVTVKSWCRVDHSGSGIEFWTLDLENPGFDPVLPWNLEQVFSLDIPPVHLAVWMSTWLKTSGGYMYEQSSPINGSMAGCFPENLKWCLVEHVCQGVKRIPLWAVLKTGYYTIKRYLYFTFHWSSVLQRKLTES